MWARPHGSPVEEEEYTIEDPVFAEPNQMDNLPYFHTIKILLLINVSRR